MQDGRFWGWSPRGAGLAARLLVAGGACFAPYAVRWRSPWWVRCRGWWTSPRRIAWLVTLITRGSRSLAARRGRAPPPGWPRWMRGGRRGHRRSGDRPLRNTTLAVGATGLQLECRRGAVRVACTGCRPDPAAFQRLAIGQSGEPPCLDNAVREWNAQASEPGAADPHRCGFWTCDNAVLGSRAGGGPRECCVCLVRRRPGKRQRARIPGLKTMSPLGPTSYLDYAELERALLACPRRTRCAGWGFVRSPRTNIACGPPPCTRRSCGSGGSGRARLTGLGVHTPVRPLISAWPARPDWTRRTLESSRSGRPGARYSDCSPTALQLEPVAPTPRVVAQGRSPERRRWPRRPPPMHAGQPVASATPAEQRAEPSPR